MPTPRRCAAETARPAQAPPAEAAQRPTVDEPFRGSPAASWASGAAGITVPKAGAVGWMSAAEVERALARSRDFLVASGLDRRVLRGERPKKAIALINPHQKDVQNLLKTAFHTPSEKNDPLLLFSRFQPSRTHLVGDIVKTRGRLTYREGERGALEVTADVTFVYPVTRAEAGGDDEIVRTIVRRVLVLSWDDPDKVITEPGHVLDRLVQVRHDQRRLWRPHRLLHPALRHGPPGRRGGDRDRPIRPQLASGAGRVLRGRVREGDAVLAGVTR